MPGDSQIVSAIDAGTLRKRLLIALEQADQHQLDFVGVKISEALDALNAAQSVMADSRHHGLALR